VKRVTISECYSHSLQRYSASSTGNFTALEPENLRSNNTNINNTNRVSSNSLKRDINVNIKMFKKYKIKMYNFSIFSIISILLTTFCIGALCAP